MKQKKMVTIKSVAAMAGVSVSAVSAAFSKKRTSSRLAPETKQKILDVANACGYAPNLTARAFQAGKSYLIALIFNSQGWSIMDRIVKGIRAVCYDNEYELLFYPCDNVEMERKNLLAAHRRNPDGILTLPLPDAGDGNLDLYEKYAAEGIPVIQILHRISDKLLYVGREFSAIVDSAIETLLQTGHKKIVLAAFDNYNDILLGGSNYLLAQEYIRNMENRNLPAEIICTTSKGLTRDYISYGIRLGEQIMKMPDRPTGIIVCANSLAYGLLAYFQRHGTAVPGEIAMIGCSDDLDVSEEILPELSHFPIPASELGEYAAKRCLGLNGNTRGKEYLLSSKFKTGKTI